MPAAGSLSTAQWDQQFAPSMVLEGVEKGAGETAEGNKVPPVWPSREERAHLPAPSKGPGLAEKVEVTFPASTVWILYILCLSVCLSLPLLLCPSPVRRIYIWACGGQTCFVRSGCKNELIMAVCVRGGSF